MTSFELGIVGYKHPKRHIKMSWQYTATSFRGGIVISFRGRENKQVSISFLLENSYY